MSHLPYPENDGQTHFPGCYRHARHHNCAVAEVDRLREALGHTANALMRLTDCFDDVRAATDWSEPTDRSARDLITSARVIEGDARAALAKARAKGAD